MSAVDVLAVMDRAIRMAPVGGYGEEREQARAAVAELLEAAGQGVMKADGRLYFDSGYSATRLRAALSSCKGGAA